MDGAMARNRHKPEEIVAKLRQVEVLTGQGASIAEAVKTIAVTETTYFRWRAEYGGMKSDQVKRLKELEVENARLRRAVSDLTLDKLILTGPPGETPKPRSSPGLRGQRQDQAADLRRTNLRGSGPTSVDPAQARQGAR
jgi:hypothetical protein